MKMRLTILMVMAVGLLGLTGQRASAGYPYSAGIDIRETVDFRAPLAAYGNWVQTDSYGLCWYPAAVDDSWRPYTNGSWSWTDGGWYWTSDEAWAWATYHYGRWVYDPYYGWLWTPGTQWAPSWVSWREGGDYIGWAPLPPGCDFGPQGTTIYAEQVVYAPNTFVFVDRRHFSEPIRPSAIIVNPTIENRTVNITKIQRVNQVVINHGPHLDTASAPERGHIPAAYDRVAYIRAQSPGRDTSVVRGTDRPSITQSVANNGRSGTVHSDKHRGGDIDADSLGNGRRN